MNQKVKFVSWKIRSHWVVFLFMLIPLSTIGQTSNTFIGTWKIDVLESINRMDAQKKAKYDSLTEEERNTIVERLKNQRVTFNGNNTVVSISLNDNSTPSQSATWTVEESTFSLIINVNGKVNRFTYQFITPVAVLLNTTSDLWFKETFITKN